MNLFIAKASNVTHNNICESRVPYIISLGSEVWLASGVCDFISPATKNGDTNAYYIGYVSPRAISYMVIKKKFPIFTTSPFMLS
jgi:hypothetical protein